MKADERKHLKENELAARLGNVWQTLASGSTTNTIIWGVILLGLVLAVGWRYYSDASFRSRSALWSQLEIASDVDKLRLLIKEHPGTAAARVARFHLARSLMEDARRRLAGPNDEDRRKAADDLETVRKEYTELAGESEVEPLLNQEALLGVAKAEETLASVPKADNEKEVRGSLQEARAAYEKLAKKYPTSFMGEQAAKRAKELNDHLLQVQAFYIALTKEHGKPPAPPPLPTPAPPVPPPGPNLPDASKAPDGKAPDPTPGAKAEDKGLQPPAGEPKDASKGESKDGPKGEPKSEPKTGGGEPKG